MAGKVLNISLNATITPLQKALENVGKMMNDFAASIEKTDKKMADSIKASVAEMNSSLEKVKQSFVNTEKAGDNAGKKGTASLRQQLRMATTEAQRLAQSVGMSDPKFIEAAKRAAALKDEMGDVNAAITAMNPDEKFKGVASALSGGVKVIAGMQGAMAAFGVESDNAAKVMAKLQGMMALSEGLNALGGMKDTLVILKTQAVAFGNTLKAAIGSTGIGLLIIALGAVAANWDKITGLINGVSSAQEKLHEQLQKSIKSKQHELEMFDAQKAQMLLAGKSEREILQARMQRINMVIKEMSADLALQKQMRDGQIAAAQRNKDILVGIIDFLARPIKALLTGIDAIGEAFGAQWNLVKKFESFEGSIANVFFDPKEVKEKSDKSIQEAELALQKMKSDYAQAQLDIRAIDKKSSDDYKKMLEENAKAFWEFEKSKMSIPVKIEPPKDMIAYLGKKTQEKLKDFKPPVIDFKIKSAGIPKEDLDRVKQLKAMTEELNSTMKNVATEGIYEFGTALGQAFAGNLDGAAGFMQTIVKIVIDAASALGKAFIGMGLASDAVKKNLFSNPYVAIAAGAALVVASAAARQVVANMGAKKMEQGGIVYGNSFVNVGEYGNAHTNPEVIAPLSKLRDLIGNNGTQKVVVEGRIYGSQISLASNRNQAVIKRVNGRR